MKNKLSTKSFQSFSLSTLHSPPPLALMPAFVYFLLLTLALCTTATTATLTSPPRVAVIGCGIGGSSFSFYLNDALHNISSPLANITTYERSPFIGGRLQHIIFGKQQAKIEVGGAAWTSSNQMMTELARRMNITTTKKEEKEKENEEPLLNSKVGIWNGTGFTKIIDELLSHPPSVLNILKAESHFLQQTSNNYAQVAATSPFRTISDFLSFGALRQYTNTSILSYFEEKNVNKNIIENALIPINRAIYNQNDNSSAFAMFGALTALENQENVPSGNSDLVHKLLTSAGANVILNTTIVRVEQQQALSNGGGGGYIVTDASGKVETYDVVVIAAPLEVTNITFVLTDEFDDDDDDDDDNNNGSGGIINREYMPWYVTVIEADGVQKKNFGPSVANENVTLPHILLTTANGTTERTPWVCIQPVGKHGKNGTDDKDVYMVYSDKKLTKLNDIFINPRVNEMYEQYWEYTFPKLIPIIKMNEKKKFSKNYISTWIIKFKFIRKFSNSNGNIIHIST